MRCLFPRTVGFLEDGKTISWSPKNYSKQYPTFQLPCGKCIECRLEYARQWSVRCVHEAQMYENNSFITLTYRNDALIADKLYYGHFQEFIRRLRDQSYRKFLSTFGKENWKLLSKSERKEHYGSFAVGVFVTGEYGDRTKRPHWHAILFNWSPSDLEYKYTSDRGDRVYSSKQLDELWGHGITEVGSVTFESAGYCARYAAKKLVHGPDGHGYEPISKKSSQHAIGKKFLEKYWQDIFNYGDCFVLNSKGEAQSVPIPRYYEKWLKKNHPDAWLRYVTEVKLKKISDAERRDMKDRKYYSDCMKKRRYGTLTGPMTTKREARKVIIEERFKRLQKHLKGDI